MPQELFRREALGARDTGWLGGISLVQPARTWLLTGAAVAVGLTVVLFLIFGTYTTRSRVVGHLVPTSGLVTVVAPASGVVSRLDFSEGDMLGAGDVLAVVAVPRATPADGDMTTALRSRLRERREGLEATHAAERGMLAAKAGSLAEQLATTREELAQIEAESDTRRQRLAIARDMLGQLQRLRRDGHVSEFQARQQESTALEVLGELQLLERQATAARRTIVQLQQAQRELSAQVEAAAAALRRDLALLGQEQLETEARGALSVSAPVGGLVATQLARRGQAVQAGQPLAILLPDDSRLEAELLVPSRAIGFIEPGDAVLLRYQAFPYQKFGHQHGRVTRISRSTLNPAAAAGRGADIATGGEPSYRVTVTLAQQAVAAYGRAEALRPGMLLEADVLGERRRLIEWLFEPLYSVKGRVLEG